MGICADDSESNLLGATCARVCPVRNCAKRVRALVRNISQSRLGGCQRYAMDYVYSKAWRSFDGEDQWQKIAVVGAAPQAFPARESCEERHDVTLFEKRDLAGGLSTFGIIGLREPVGISLAEVEMIQRLGVRIETGREIGKDLALTDCRRNLIRFF